MSSMPSAAVAVCAAALAVLPSVAHAADPVTYRVVGATHVSSSEKRDDRYRGRSDVRWSLVRPTRMRPHRLELREIGPAVSGVTEIAVRGRYAIDVETPAARCAFRAPTGSRAHALVAPGPFMLTVGPHPRDADRTVLSFDAVRASLANPYLPSGCKTSVDGEPDHDITSTATLSPRMLGRRRFTVRMTGATKDAGIRYRWETRLTFVRVPD